MSDYRTRTKPWYGTARWKRKRAECLARDKICQMCLPKGIVATATVADHKTPHKGDERLFWEGELQGICKPCHDSDKKLIESGKGPRQQIGADGWPV